MGEIIRSAGRNPSMEHVYAAFDGMLIGLIDPLNERRSPGREHDTSQVYVPGTELVFGWGSSRTEKIPGSAFNREGHPGDGWYNTVKVSARVGFSRKVNLLSRTTYRHESLGDERLPIAVAAFEGSWVSPDHVLRRVPDNGRIKIEKMPPLHDEHATAPDLVGVSRHEGSEKLSGLSDTDRSRLMAVEAVILRNKDVVERLANGEPAREVLADIGLTAVRYS